MSILSTPPSLFFPKTSNHYHYHYPLSSFSPLPSPTLHLSLSSLHSSSSRIFSSRSNDEPNKSKPKRKPKPSSPSSSPGVPNFTISGPDDEWDEDDDDDDDDEWGQEPKPKPNPPSSAVTPESNVSVTVSDEWGEKSGPEPEPESKFTEPDPPTREDEWAPPSINADDVSETTSTTSINTSTIDKNWELKRCLLDSVYGSDLGFRASAEVRAEVSELVSQLEAVNPSPKPTEVSGLLDGNWILVYTAFSELLPLLAVGTTQLLKVQQISQAIDTTNQTVENSTTLSSPFATFTFSATATFDVRSPSRIQVRFKEATFKPPQIKSQIDLPESVDVFGQKVTLPPVQQFLSPLQDAATSISRALYGLPPLKISIPGERTASWLLFTYVDEDFRISRGDGGLFVLVREGSPLLDQ
ncbi:hypothetical protein BVRB_5g106940 [Beta vulgaris subsp. vulgaris]|nr:hypothetical protein BVRB_5g106940 [Beta vulgaris subsp. vulgaris]